jgi:parallel beta-helix repeat protein
MRWVWTGHQMSAAARISSATGLAVLLATTIVIVTEQHKFQRPEPESNLRSNKWLDASLDGKDTAGIGLAVTSHMEYANKTMGAFGDNVETKAAIGTSSNILNSRGQDNNNDNVDNINRRILLQMKENMATPTASCGQVVTKDIVLTNDLECPEIGMIVKEDGITIHLNNHKLSLANTSDTKIPELEHIGILISNQKNVTVEGPGIITGFDKAIEFVGSGESSAQGLSLSANKIGILLTASNNITIYNNAIYQNTIAIASQSCNDGKIVFNQILQNANQGIVLMTSQQFIVSANSAIDNGYNGIFLDIHSFNNMLLSNSVFNQTIDLNNANGVPVDVSANSFLKNNCHKATPDGLC